ncbi:hypothetical protein Bbelb_171280 [Branchiostoma belcheri]|nr:hypothetical protein Bbelb_171280 [Branchiostoma belcheri]
MPPPPSSQPTPADQKGRVSLTRTSLNKLHPAHSTENLTWAHAGLVPLAEKISSTVGEIPRLRFFKVDSSEDHQKSVFSRTIFRKFSIRWAIFHPLALLSSQLYRSRDEK